MVLDFVRAIERLNLAQQHSAAGGHFPDVMALLAIVFGGSFLLFAWKHHEYYLGVTGFIVGGWIGLMLKSHVASPGGPAPVLYIGVCAVAGAFVCVQFRQLVGMLLGGFSASILGAVLSPSMFQAGDHGLVSVSAAFLMGGGLGAMFPKFFFVFNSSLIGAVFVTWGIATGLLAPFTSGASPNARVMIHLLVFLPLLLFGVLYQMVASQRDEMPVFVAAPIAADPRRPAA